MMPPMSDETRPVSNAKPAGMAFPLILTFLLLPVGLIVTLLMANNARKYGQPQQPLWTGFAIGAVLAVIVGVLLTR
jgi:hypothetical protein